MEQHPEWQDTVTARWTNELHPELSLTLHLHL